MATDYTPERIAEVLADAKRMVGSEIADLSGRTVHEGASQAQYLDQNRRTENRLNLARIVEQLQRERDEARLCWNHTTEALNLITAERDAFRAENERLRKQVDPVMCLECENGNCGIDRCTRTVPIACECPQCKEPAQ